MEGELVIFVLITKKVAKRLIFKGIVRCIISNEFNDSTLQSIDRWAGSGAKLIKIVGCR